MFPSTIISLVLGIVCSLLSRRRYRGSTMCALLEFSVSNLIPGVFFPSSSGGNPGGGLLLPNGLPPPNPFSDLFSPLDRHGTVRRRRLHFPQQERAGVTNASVHIQEFLFFLRPPPSGSGEKLPLVLFAFLPCCGGLVAYCSSRAFCQISVLQRQTMAFPIGCPQPRLVFFSNRRTASGLGVRIGERMIACCRRASPLPLARLVAFGTSPPFFPSSTPPLVFRSDTGPCKYKNRVFLELVFFSVEDIHRALSPRRPFRRRFDPPFPFNFRVFLETTCSSKWA